MRTNLHTRAGRDHAATVSRTGSACRARLASAARTAIALALGVAMPIAIAGCHRDPPDGATADAAGAASPAAVHAPEAPPAIAEATVRTAPLKVQVLSAQYITADTVRVEIALISTAPPPEPSASASAPATGSGSPASASSVSASSVSASSASASSGSASVAGSGTAAAASSDSAAPSPTSDRLDLARALREPVIGDGSPGDSPVAHAVGARTFTAADLCLLTADNSRRLFVLRDPQDKPVTGGSFDPLQAGERRVIWAVFPSPAPGPSAAALRVTLQVGGVILRDVPVAPLPAAANPS